MRWVGQSALSRNGKSSGLGGQREVQMQEILVTSPLHKHRLRCGEASKMMLKEDLTNASLTHYSFLECYINNAMQKQ